jgi:hypothetical protein
MKAVGQPRPRKKSENYVNIWVRTRSLETPSYFSIENCLIDLTFYSWPQDKRLAIRCVAAIQIKLFQQGYTVALKDWKIKMMNWPEIDMLLFSCAGRDSGFSLGKFSCLP